MRSFFLAVFVGLLVLSSSPAMASELDQKLNTKVEQLMELTGARDLGLQMSSGIIQQMTVRMKQNRADMPPRAFDIVAEVVNEFLEAKSETLFDQVIPLYAKYFSEEDIDVLIAFYSTPTGRKVIARMPALLQETLQITGEWFQKRAPELQKMVRSRLISEGFVQ